MPKSAGLIKEIIASWHYQYPMDYRALIKTDHASASASLSYKGTPEAGMLAWLDSNELKQWWKADTAIIEPFEGGMFYITWHENSGRGQHALYGIMDKVDTQNNNIAVAKIMYISPTVKIGHIHLHLHFEAVGEETRMDMTSTHNISGQLLHLYQSSILDSWPKTIAIFKNYMERSVM
jgi:hypothetical protein